MVPTSRRSAEIDIVLKLMEPVVLLVGDAHRLDGADWVDGDEDGGLTLLASSCLSQSSSPRGSHWCRCCPRLSSPRGCGL
jgi:hypothetical protein